MFITTYLINNVLRVYGDLLCKGRVAVRQKNTDDGLSDKISISIKARRKTIVDNMTANIVDNMTANIVNKITRDGPYEKVEKEVFEKLENEYGGHLAISGEDSDGLIFKEIDENGETINSLSIEDSNLLTKKLMEITEETINKNMK
jgi:urease accessory protein UreH